MIESGNEEQGLARLEQAMKDHPNDVEIRNYYLRHKAVAVQRYLQIGDNARSRRAPRRSGSRLPARAALRPGQRERAGRPRRGGARARHRRPRCARRERGDEARRRRRPRWRRRRRPSSSTRRSARRAPSCARSRSRRVKAEGTSPQLAAALKNTITIELRDAPVRTVFELISQARRPQLRLRPRRAARPARHRVRARHHDRGSDPLRAGHQPARAPRAQRRTRC